MYNCNTAGSVKLGKLFKKFKLNSKNKKRIIQQTRKDYSTWSSLERLSRNLEFKNLLDKKTTK